MAKCRVCKREMKTGASCSLPMMRFTPKRGTAAKQEFPKIPFDGQGRCGNCGVEPGGIHHPGCDNERCPKCEGQAISCDCNETYSIADTSAPPKAVAK